MFNKKIKEALIINFAIANKLTIASRSRDYSAGGGSDERKQHKKYQSGAIEKKTPNRVVPNFEYIMTAIGQLRKVRLVRGESWGEGKMKINVAQREQRVKTTGRENDPGF